MKDFSFQGKVFFAKRLAGGKRGAMRFAGDAPKCDLGLTADEDTRNESYSGQRQQSAVLQKGKTAKLTLQLNEASIENLALSFYSESATVAAGSVTGEVAPAALVVGDYIATDKPDISALVVTDSTPVTPLTLTLGTHYRIDSAKAGTIEIINLGAFVQPLKLAYSHGATVDLAMFTKTPDEFWLFLDGINTIDESPVQVDLYRVKAKPASNLSLINEGFGQLDLECSVLFDSDAAADAALGGFGRIRQSGT